MNRFFQWLGNIFFLVIPLGGAAWGGYMLWKDINQSFAQINRQPIGRVERTERMVQRQLATRAIWEQAVGGLPLYPEDKIRTGDASAVRIALNSGDVIDLSSNSFITLPSDGEGGIQVESGTVIPVVSSGGLSIQTAGGGSVAEAGEWDFGDDLGSINGGTGVENLVINTIQPTVGLAFSNESFAVDAYMSPSARSTLPVYLTVPAPEAVMGWGLAVRTNDGTLLRTYSGENSRAPPERIEFDGKDDRGRTLPEGAYNWQLSVLYRNGFVSTAVSPPFFVDATPPRAVIKPEYPVFSPNNDGRKDQMVFIQEGTPEVTWRGEIRSASDGAAPVRAVRFTGGLPERFSWNGITDTGAPAPDGDYVYQVFSTDQAGNSGASAPVTFTLSTMETPLRLAADSRAFSPGSRTGRSRITLTPSAEVAGGIASWKIDILNGDGAEVRTFERTGGLPGSVPWDGTLPSGKTAPDGVYTARLTVDYSMGNEPVALSEPFVVDTEPPSGEVALAYRNFSPNGDGRKDTIPFAVTTRGDDSWLAVIRNSAGAEVRSWEWAGEAPLIDWDGTDGAGALAPDGSYTFTLSATDEAGNRSAVPPEALALSTFATPVDIAVNYPAFSPVSQGAQSRITITPAVGVNRGIDSWRMDIIDADGGEVRNFAGTGAVPGSFVWDGASSLGKRAPDGVYAARIRLVYDMGNEPSAWSGPFVMDTVPPEGSVTTGFTVFSPNGDGLKDYMLFTAVTFGDEPWRGEVTDSAGKTVRSWEWTGSAPPLVWDGTDSAGLPAPDGTYAFALSARDDAGNRCERTIPGIRLDARKPTALVTASAQGISPSRDSSVRLGLVPSIRDGIESWKLELLGRSGAVFRSFPAEPSPGALPESIPWDGRNAAGAVTEGTFTPALTLIYRKGDIVTVRGPEVTVDFTAPTLAFSAKPSLFSPDNDGVDDTLSIRLEATDDSSVASWSFVVTEPQPPFNSFYQIEGRGNAALTREWDGRSSSGELVQSATDYPYTFRAADTLGNTASIKGKIGVDVLVNRDGDTMRIIVPSIVFRANQADFDGLGSDVVAANNRILRRIAEILNKFPEYRVQVEGHANPVTRTAAEEAEELQPLSERRARATVDFLVGFGVRRDRLSAVGMGGKRPIVPFTDREGWWKNRRVEFILIK